MKVSLAIPYHQSPDTAFFLGRLLDSIWRQTFTDYEIVLTAEGPMAHNHNAAILKSKGEIVQMLQMDDMFSSSDSLQNIVDGFKDENVIWQITASQHTSGPPHNPLMTNDIYTGNNRLGSISTLSFRRENQLLFEEPLTWLVDSDLYYRLFLKYGPPNILKTYNVTIDIRTDRLTHTIPDKIKLEEYNYLMKKYG